MSHAAKCYAAMAANEPLRHHTILRRATDLNDVCIDIKWAGICHSDIHQVRDEWSPGTFPMVPGHEIVGVCREVGSEVTKFKPGDIVGVGCMLDSCRQCPSCRVQEEQYCATGCVFTYNSTYKYKHCTEHSSAGGNPTYGGYAQSIVVDEKFCLQVPRNLDMAGAAPLLCAGITTYSPMIKFGLRPHHKFAVAGLGGLGHMGAKFGRAFSCHTTVISRGKAKKKSAIEDLKADAFLDSTSVDEMTAAEGTFDFILDTISAPHDIDALLGLLKTDGKLIMVGVPPEAISLKAGNLIFGRKCIGGSLIGGTKETQEMLDFCGRNSITCDVEKISADKINEAYEKVLKSDVKYRFVIDVATI